MVLSKPFSNISSTNITKYANKVTVVEKQRKELKFGLHIGQQFMHFDWFCNWIRSKTKKDLSK